MFRGKKNLLIEVKRKKKARRATHRVAGDAPGVHEGGGVEHAGAAVEGAAEALRVHDAGHHRPHPVPAVLAEHLHLPQLVHVLCQRSTRTGSTGPCQPETK